MPDPNRAAVNWPTIDHRHQLDATIAALRHRNRIQHLIIRCTDLVLALVLTGLIRAIRIGLVKVAVVVTTIADPALAHVTMAVVIIIVATHRHRHRRHILRRHLHRYLRRQNVNRD